MFLCVELLLIHQNFEISGLIVVLKKYYLDSAEGIWSAASY